MWQNLVRGGAKISQGGAKKILRASRLTITRYSRNSRASRVNFLFLLSRFFVPKNLAPPWLKSCSRPCSFSSLSRSEIYFSYEKRASFLGDPVPLFNYISVHFLIRRLIEHIQNSFENRYFRALCCFLLQGVPFFYFSHNSYEADWARIFIHPLLFISFLIFSYPSKSMIMNNFLMKFV